MNVPLFPIALISITLALIFLILFLIKSGTYKRIYNRFKDVIDIEVEKDKVERQHKNKENELAELRESYKEKPEIKVIVVSADNVTRMNEEEVNTNA